MIFIHVLLEVAEKICNVIFIRVLISHSALLESASIDSTHPRSRRWNLHLWLHRFSGLIKNLLADLSCPCIQSILRLTKSVFPFIGLSFILSRHSQPGHPTV